jgi:hypothetical protein
MIQVHMLVGELCSVCYQHGRGYYLHCDINVFGIMTVALLQWILVNGNIQLNCYNVLSS